MLSSCKYKSIEEVLTGIDSEGVRYLQLFLKDYVKLTGETVNAGCKACIQKYYSNYIKLTSQMENNSDYVLHKKREGLPLRFGSNIRVSNANLTNEYAQILIERYSEIQKLNTLDYLFSKYPKPRVTLEEVKPKVKRKAKK